MALPSPRSAALAAFLVSLALASVLVWWAGAGDLARERERVEAVARDQVRALGGVVERSLTASYALGALLRQGGGEIADFDAVAAEMLAFYPSVSVLALSPGGVIRQTAPLEPNQASLGFDQFADPVQGEEARRTRDSGVLTLAGPLELVQGGLGVVGRLPVFLDNPDEGGSTFWGLVSVVMPLERVLAEAGLHEMAGRGIHFELWRLDPNSGERSVIASGGGTPLPSPVSEGVELPNGTWTLSAAPAGGWAAGGILARRAAAALLFALLAGWVGHLLVALRVHQRNLETEVEARTAEIRAARNQLEAMLAAIPDLLFELDGEGRYLAFHSRSDQLLAAPRERLVGTTTRDWLPPAAVEEIEQALAEADARGWSTGRQYSLDLPQGRHWFEISVARKPDPEGGAPTFMALVRDITARRAADEALRESEARYLQSQKMESVGRLAGGVAHDFNNLLTVIRGAADMASESLPSGHVAHDDLAQIRSAAERGAALTQQLLGTSSQQVIRPVRLDLNRVVEDLLELVRRLIGEDVRVTTDLSMAPAWIHADRNQLSQIFLNLAANARDALPQGGTLSLQTRRLELQPSTPDTPLPHASRELAPGPWIRLRVEDSGLGMPPEVMDRIFEPFFTTKPMGRGTGLGLATVYGIVRQSGGDIMVASEPGGGSRFDLWFPAAELPDSGNEGAGGTPVGVEPGDATGEAPGAEGSASRAAPWGDGSARGPDGGPGGVLEGGAAGFLDGGPAGGPGEGPRESPAGFPDGGARVLLVEDEPGILRMACRALERAGFRVVAAGSGEAALELAASEPHLALHALVTDVVMPGMNGVELALRLRQLHGRLPILFTSGFADHPVLRERGLPHGSAFLPKPYAAEGLVAELRRLLGGPVAGEVGGAGPAPTGVPVPSAPPTGDGAAEGPRGDGGSQAPPEAP